MSNAALLYIFHLYSMVVSVSIRVAQELAFYENVYFPFVSYVTLSPSSTLFVRVDCRKNMLKFY